MNERRQLARARLVERVRTVEKSHAARASAQAEMLSGRLHQVAEKTRALAGQYRCSDGIATADDLLRHAAMRRQLHTLGALNASHLADARQRADAALAELGNAERKRARIAEDRRTLEASIANQDAARLS